MLVHICEIHKEGILYSGVCVHSLLNLPYTCKANTVRGNVIHLLTSKSSQQFAVKTFKSAKDNVLNLSVHSVNVHTVMSWSLCRRIRVKLYFHKAPFKQKSLGVPFFQINHWSACSSPSTIRAIKPAVHKRRRTSKYSFYSPT